jgi:hypothetical protein
MSYKYWTSSATSLNFYQITRRYNTEEGNIHSYAPNFIIYATYYTVINTVPSLSHKYTAKVRVVTEKKSHASLSSLLDGGELLTWSCGSFTPCRNSPCAFPTPLGGSQSLSEQGRDRETLPLSGETHQVFRHSIRHKSRRISLKDNICTLKTL